MKFNIALLGLWFAVQSSAQIHPGSVTLSGSHADYERLFEREFDVGPGIQRLKMSLDYSGEDRRTVIDLGLRGPAGGSAVGVAAARKQSKSARRSPAISTTLINQDQPNKLSVQVHAGDWFSVIL